MGELEERINSVLNDPEQLARISAMAQSLMGGAGREGPVEGESAAPPGKNAASEDSALPDFGKLASLLRGAAGQNNPRLAALEALAPSLDPRRGEKLRRAMRLARVLRLAQTGLFGAEDGHV